MTQKDRNQATTPSGHLFGRSGSMLKWFKKENDAKTLEKELASIASKITAHETTLASLRASHRRYKGALTLYLILFYIVYLAGWFMFFARRTPKDLRWLGESAPTVVGPFIIAGLRYVLSAFYNRRIASYEAMLVEQRSLQHEKIEAFKTRTDFYSTKLLIDRYSGSESPKSEATTPSKSQVQPKKVTGLSPQNTQRKQGQTEQQIGVASALATPASLQGTVPTPPHLSGVKPKPRSSLTAIQPSSSPIEARHAVQDLRAIPAPHHWYDRILDVVIGEDESAASSRYQLEQRLLKKEEEVRRLEVEMMRMQQALQEREGNETMTRTLPDREQGSTARDESDKSETRARRTSRRLKAKSTVQEDASDDDEEE